MLNASASVVIVYTQCLAKKVGRNISQNSSIINRTAKSNPTLRETTIWLPYFFSENAFFFRFLTLSPAKQPIHTKQKKKPKNAFSPYIRRNRKEKGGKTVSSCSVIDDNGVCGGCVAVYNNSTKKAVPLVLSEK